MSNGREHEEIKSILHSISKRLAELEEKIDLIDSKLEELVNGDYEDEDEEEYGEYEEDEDEEE